MDVSCSVPDLTGEEVEEILAGLPEPGDYRVHVKPLRYRDRPHLAAWTDFEDRSIAPGAGRSIRSARCPLRRETALEARRERAPLHLAHEGITFRTPEEVLRFSYCHEWMHWWLKEVAGRPRPPRRRATGSRCATSAVWMSPRTTRAQRRQRPAVFSLRSSHDSGRAGRHRRGGLVPQLTVVPTAGLVARPLVGVRKKNRRPRPAVGGLGMQRGRARAARALATLALLTCLGLTAPQAFADIGSPDLLDPSAPATVDPPIATESGVETVTEPVVEATTDDPTSSETTASVSDTLSAATDAASQATSRPPARRRTMPPWVCPRRI